jgi:ComF family protein
MINRPVTIGFTADAKLINVERALNQARTTMSYTVLIVENVGFWKLFLFCHQGVVMLKTLVRMLFPPYCCLCDTQTHSSMDICTSCLQMLPNVGQACICCALPMSRSSASTRCGKCISQEPHFTHTIAPYRYYYPVDYFVQRLKFMGEQKYGRLMGELLAAEVLRQGLAEMPQLLLPVPLHRSRYRSRGFNQADIIAKYCGAKLNIAVSTHHLKRIKNTTPQTALSKAKRHKNIHGAFVLNTSLLPSYVALIDDVMTTGSTAREVASTLLSGGVRRVDVWVVARTP